MLGGVLSGRSWSQFCPVYPSGHLAAPQTLEEGMILSTPPMVLSYPDQRKTSPGENRSDNPFFISNFQMSQSSALGNPFSTP